MDSNILDSIFNVRKPGEPEPQKSRKAKFFRDQKPQYDPTYFDSDVAGKQRLLEQRIGDVGERIETAIRIIAVWPQGVLKNHKYSNEELKQQADQATISASLEDAYARIRFRGNVAKFKAGDVVTIRATVGEFWRTRDDAAVAKTLERTVGRPANQPMLPFVPFTFVKDVVVLTPESLAMEATLKAMADEENS